MERRLEKNEKIMSFFEEILRLKEDEKKNDKEIDKNLINDLNKRVSLLEDSINVIFKKFNEFSDIFCSKIEKIEKMYNKSIEKKNSLGDFYAGKLSELEGLLKKNEFVIENKIDSKFIEIEKNIDSKIDDMLNLINEVNKIGENNELQNIENKETLRMIQSDHIDFIKIVSILKEKSDALDYIYQQITDLKQNYQKVLQLVGEQTNEEDKILNNMFNAENKNFNPSSQDN